jgi:hypothetical protein
VIEADGVYDTEFFQVIFVWNVISMPSNDIEWRVILFGREKGALELGDDFEVFDGTVLKPCRRREEITWIS